jgi:hypothetical protein
MIDFKNEVSVVNPPFYDISIRIGCKSAAKIRSSIIVALN